MNKNLSNIYEYLKKSATDFDVLLTEPVSYLKTITGSDCEIIFICKKAICQKENYEELIPQLKSLNRDRDALNLTGSPLRDTSEIDSFDLSLDFQLSNLTLWSKEEEMYEPIKLDKARSIICNMNLQKEGQKSNGSLWLLCDATDGDKTVLMNFNFEDHYNSSGSIKFIGLISANKINSNDLIKQHSSLIKGTTKIETVIDNLYNIKANIRIKLNWNTSAIRPILINTKNCDCTIFQTIKLNDTLSVAEGFYRQLLILYEIREAILAYKENESNNSEAVYHGSGIDIEILSQEITNIMTNISGYGHSHSVNYIDSNAIEAVVIRAENRSNTDMTDKLWEVLKSCSSYKDLKTAFNYVFQCAAVRNIINIPSNKTTLAEIIREVSQHRLAIPSLTGSEPLELLLEIGLEKVYKDYEYIFTESKICSSTDLIIENNEITRETKQNLQKRKTLLHNNNNTKLDHFSEIVGFQNSKFNKTDVEDKLSKLLQIHSILEHLLSIEINLNLENVSNQIFLQLIKKPVKAFEQIIKCNYDKIVISIMIEKVLHHVENKDPHARRIIMASQNKFREVESTFYYNMDNIFPTNIFPGINTDDKEMSKENIYFLWNYTKIKTKKLNLNNK